MSFDLIVKGGTLPDGSVADIGISGDRIAAIEPAISAEAGRVVDAAGNLVSPPFVDAHFHMDATLSLGLPRINESGTLLEGIALWGELKPLLTHEAVRRARARLLRLGGVEGPARHPHAMSTSATTGCWRSRRCSRCKKRVAPYLDLQLVAFPQDGFYRSPTARENLDPRARHGRRRRRRHPAFRAHDGGRRALGRRRCARSPPSAA